MSTREQIREVLKFIASAFVNFDPSPETLSTWNGILSDMEFEDVKLAALQLVSSDREFPPTPGQVRKTAEQLAFSRTGKPTNGAQAWDLIKGIATRNRIDPEKKRANAEAAKIGLDFQLCIKAFGFGRIKNAVWPTPQGHGFTTFEMERLKRDFIEHWDRWHTIKVSVDRPRLTDGAMKMIQGGQV